MIKKIVLISIIAIAVTAIGYYKYTGTKTTGYKMPQTVVKTAPVKQGSIPLTVSAIGTLSAKSVDITPEIPGHVEEINFKDGASVKKGDILVQLDDAVFKAKFDSAKAKLAFSENKYKRLSKLGKKGVVAQQDLDQAEADLKERKADMQEALVMLNKMRLIAPFDGVVGKSLVSPGDYVNIGQKIVSLTDKQHLKIEYSVPEKFLPFIKLGQKVTIKAVAYPGEEFVGKLAYISPTINQDNRSIALYADINNDNSKLAPGMFVEATQELGNKDNALLVPARSLVPVLEGTKIYKVVDGKAFSVDVVIGQRSSEMVQIVEGLQTNDIVITDGQMKVKNGMPVKIES